MLGGLAPILIFNFKKLPPSIAPTIAAIPVVSQIVNAIDLPAIPLYLSEELTGISIDTQEKNIDIETTTETLTSGGTPETNQRGLNSSVKVNLIAIQDSIGFALLSALAELVFPKVTSKEYSLTYLNGPITVFGGLLHSFAVSQDSNDERLKVTIELIKQGISTKAPIPVVQKLTAVVPL